LADRWIVSRAQRLTAEVTRLTEAFQFGEAGRQIHEFFWSEYCDWYLEIAKIQLGDYKRRERTAHIVRAVLDRALRLLHPYMPFVTEEIWQHLYAETPAGERPAPALIIAAWPRAESSQEDTAAEADFTLVREIITRIRDAKKEAGVEPVKRVQVILAAGPRASLLKGQAALIETLARTEPPGIERKLSAKPEQAMALVAGGVEIYLPLAGLLDVEKEVARLRTQAEGLRQAIARSEQKLANEQFVTRARPEVIQQERDALAAAQATLAKIAARQQELTSR
jgi:valyl-tRNA synthetase